MNVTKVNYMLLLLVWGCVAITFQSDSTKKCLQFQKGRYVFNVEMGDTPISTTVEHKDTIEEFPKKSFMYKVLELTESFSFCFSSSVAARAEIEIYLENSTKKMIESKQIRQLAGIANKVREKFTKVRAESRLLSLRYHQGALMITSLTDSFQNIKVVKLALLFGGVLVQLYVLRKMLDCKSVPYQQV